MTALLSIFASSFVIALSGAMMPGTLITATLSESSRRGFIAGPLMIAGHAILEIILIACLLAGLGPLLEQESVFAVIAITGAVVILWMASGMIRSIPGLSLALEAEGGRAGNPVVTGILMSLSNPYWIIWWATIGLGYILYSWSFGIAGLVFFFTGHILADLAWYSLVSATVAKGRRFMTDRAYRMLIAVCALFLVLFAIYFAWSGFMKLAEMY